MSTPLLIIVNCSERKRDRGQRIHLGGVLKDEPLTRASHWWRALNQPDRSLTTALDLYQGDHWTQVVRLRGRAERLDHDPELWIVSAGYGLISETAQITPYAATFGRGHADSVSNPDLEDPRRQNQSWWEAISRFHGPESGQPRTLRDLMTSRPNHDVLLALSPVYLDAVSDDLVGAIEGMPDPDRLVVVSGTPGPKNRRLLPNWVPSFEVFRRDLGGACTSLNARVAEHLLTLKWGRFSASAFQRYANDYRACRDPLEHPDRQPISNEEVLAFIRSQLQEHPKATHTGLLKKLRGQGIACEQSRFKNLFHHLGGPGA